MAIAPKTLIFMRRYEVIDFHWGFLAIFYKMEASTKIYALNLRSLIFIRRYEVTDMLYELVQQYYIVVSI